MLKHGVKVEVADNEAVTTIREFDLTLIGTSKYLGIAKFWHRDHAGYLSNSYPCTRKAAHDALIEAGLKLDASSDKHLQILEKIING